MTRVIGVIALLVVRPCDAQEIEILDLGKEHVVFDFETKVGATELYMFEAHAAGIEAVSKIASVMGVPLNMEVRVANVESAAAVVYDGRQYILYSRVFAEEIYQKLAEGAEADWAILGMLAHEVGHHIAGHTSGGLGDEHPHKLELQADKYGGYVAGRLGASMAEALTFIEEFAQEKASETHPPASARREAVVVGWGNARQR